MQTGFLPAALGAPWPGVLGVEQGGVTPVLLRNLGTWDKHAQQMSEEKSGVEWDTEGREHSLLGGRERIELAVIHLCRKFRDVPETKR